MGAGDLQASPRELAELLWLSRRIPIGPHASVAREELPGPAAGDPPRVQVAGPTVVRRSPATSDRVSASDDPPGTSAGRGRFVADAGGIESFLEVALNRTVALSWMRALRGMAGIGPATDRSEIDVRATAHETARARGLLRPVLVHPVEPRTSLVVLLDDGLSTAPWREAFDRLVELARTSRCFAYVGSGRLDLFAADLSLRRFARPGLNTAVVILSDGCGPAVTSGALGRALAELPTGTRTLWLHPWPRWAWGRTPVGVLPMSGQDRWPTVALISLDAAGLLRAGAWLRGATESLHTRRVPVVAPIRRPQRPPEWQARTRALIGELSVSALRLLALAAAIPGRLDIALLRALGPLLDEPVEAFEIGQVLTSGCFRRVDESVIEFECTEAREALLAVVPRCDVEAVLLRLVESARHASGGDRMRLLGIPVSLLVRGLGLAPEGSDTTDERGYAGYRIALWLLRKCRRTASPEDAGPKGPSYAPPELELTDLAEGDSAKLRAWDAVERAWERGETLTGTVVRRVKAGLAVDVGVLGFLPGSLVDIRPVRELERFIGQTAELDIVKLNKRRGNLVVSRRGPIERQRAALREETLLRLVVGNRVRGTVKNLTEYGAFLDLGGIDGLLHMEDMTWGRITHPSQVVQLGEALDVVVLKVELGGDVSGSRQDKVGLGLKQLTPDPWDEVALKYVPGEHARGRIVSLTDYGAFVELESGIEGLIHISEMSWTKRIKHPSKVVSLGDSVEAVILEVLPDIRRMSLSIKLLGPNPWSLLPEKYPVGTRLVGPVRNITDFGIFIAIEEGIDGLVHLTDMSWTRKIKHPSEIYRKHDEVEAVVLGIDVEQERFRLGIKQLVNDPWLNVHDEYPVGTRLSVVIRQVVVFGLFAVLPNGIEGLIHRNELSWDDEPRLVPAVGDTCDVVVVSVDGDARKLSLSIRQLTPDPRMAPFEPGATVRGRIRRIKPDGLVLALSSGVNGFVQVEDLSWTRRIRDPADRFRVGQELEAVVLWADAGAQTVRLGVKQLAADPWEMLIPDQYRAGRTVEGRITGVREVGVFVTLPLDVTGLIPVREFGAFRRRHPGVDPVEGQRALVTVIRLDPSQRRITLSLVNVLPDDE